MNIKKLIIGCFATFLALGSITACTSSQSYGPTFAIDADILEMHVRKLASDESEGRGAGYPGEKKAAAYIANAFADMDLAPLGDVSESGRSYFQSFEFHPRQPTVPWEILETQNVVAVLPGSDLSEEIIVLGAHHDGQGMAGQANAGRFGKEDGTAWQDDIWNSASDNATSIAAILEIARVLAAADRRLRRTVVFVTFSAEEYSLNGAIEYVSRPPLSLERHVAMINLEKLVGDPEIDFITATAGSSPAFDEITDLASIRSGIDIKPFYPGIVTDTDHYPFVARGVPGIVIGTGSYLHIHEPGDEHDRLDYALLKNRTDYILQFLVEAANRNGVFEFTGNVDGYYGVLGSPPTAAELRIRNLDPAINALKVSAVIPDMSGERVGVSPGDIITAINGNPLGRQDGGYFTLSEIVGDQPPDVIDVHLVRKNEAIILRLPRN